jgi:hypothetical protein
MRSGVSKKWAKVMGKTRKEANDKGIRKASIFGNISDIIKSKRQLVRTDEMTLKGVGYPRSCRSTYSVTSVQRVMLMHSFPMMSVESRASGLKTKDRIRR